VNVYQNARRIESTAGAIGEIRRLTVAVAVDERAGAAATGPTGAAAGQGITPESVARIEALVRDAVGVDSARGDRLTVTAVPFQVNLAAAGLVPAEPAAGLVTRALPLAERLARPIFGLLGILLTFVLAGRVLRGTNIRTAATGAAAALAAVIPTHELPPLPSPETDPSLQLKRRVTADSDQRPETAARVVRAWMAES
jgi:flagellar M-ring protein FliF